MRRETWSGGLLLEAWDAQAGTYTRFNPDGSAASSRVLTADEIAALTPPPDPRATLRAQIQAAESPAELQALMVQLLDLGV